MIRDGKLLPQPVADTPTVLAEGQGGLLDIALSNNFAGSRVLFLSYSIRSDGGFGTAIARATLSADGASLSDVREIFRMNQFTEGYCINCIRIISGYFQHLGIAEFEISQLILEDESLTEFGYFLKNSNERIGLSFIPQLQSGAAHYANHDFAITLSTSLINIDNANMLAINLQYSF